MRILILGGDGMLGHQLLKQLRVKHETRVTLRQEAAAYRPQALFTADNAYTGIDLRSTDKLEEVMARFKPAAVLNCVGIVKQRCEAKSTILSLELNSLLPHRLALLCRTYGSRLVHFSTDCVFSGKTGNYSESDTPDAADLYGKSKLLGEVTEPGCLTLRTSIIGEELSRKKSLLEWFLAQRGTVHGYEQMIYSGFTTLEMSRIVEKILVEHPQATGLYHVSSAAISKYELLCMIKDELGLSVTILPDSEYRCNRSLDSTRFRAEFNYLPPTWKNMIAELATDIRRRQ
jgi:dTDP-4-dehydrorhamnose reductase